MIEEKAQVKVQINSEQAKNELRILEESATRLRDQINKAYEAGEEKKMNKLQKELRKVNTEINTMRRQSVSINEAMKDLSTKGPAELNKIIKAINSELSSGRVRRGSEEWKLYQERLKAVRKELRNIQDESRENESWLNRMNNNLSKWGGMIATGLATITGVSYSLNQMRAKGDAKEASAANLQALTGLDDDSVAWLTRQAEELSTKATEAGVRIQASSKDILEGFMLVGSAKPELLGVKEELRDVSEWAFILATASKGPVKEAVDGLTLAMNQYGAGADEAGRYVNALAAGSKEGSADVASQTAAIVNAGVAASVAKVPIEQLIGSIQTLAERGIKDEVAGTGLKTFFLKLESGAEDTRPSVVGLQTALENLRKKNLDVVEMQKMFGLESYTVAQAMISGADKVEKYTQAVTGTNIAMEQAIINSKTSEAIRAQNRNKITESSIILADKLAPALNSVTGWFTRIITILPPLIDWFVKHGRTVMIAAGILAAYVAVQQAEVAISKLQVLWNEKIVASFTKLWNVLRANPWATLISAAVLLISYYKEMNAELSVTEKAQKKVNDAMKEATACVETETAEMQALLKIAKDETASKNDREKAIKRLNQLSPEYLGNLTIESINTKDADMAVKNYTKSLLANAQAKAINAKLEEIEKQKIEAKDNIVNYSNWNNPYLSGLDYFNNYFEKSRNAFFTLVSGNGLKGWNLPTTIALHAIKRYNKDIEGLDKEKQILLEKLEGIIRGKLEVSKEGSNQILNSVQGGLNVGSVRKENVALIAEETRYQNELLELKKKYLSDATMTQDQYNEEREQIELNHLRLQLQVSGVEQEQREKMLSALLDAEIAYKNKMQKQTENQAREAKAAEEKALDERLAMRKRQYEVEQSDLQNALYMNKISEEEYLFQSGLLESAYWMDLLNNYALSEEQKTEIQKKQSEKRTEKNKEEYEKQKDMAKKYTDLFTGIATDFGTSIGELIEDGTMSMKQFTKETINLALDALEKILYIKFLEIQIKNVAATTPFNWVGAAKAAAEIAVFKASFAVLKGLVNNFYDGGFTGSGAWNQPQGIVHSNEFVANRFATANPAVMPVLQLIDRAQKNNTIANIRSNDIARVVGVPEGSGDIVPVASGNIDPLLIAKMLTAVATLNKRLEEPIYTYTTATGKMGVNEAQRLAETMQNNSKRKR